ncbi:MAG TPA: PilZ domain-containing protein [Fimbriiglobus sp.]|jgi:hypothetical protein
MWNPPPFALSWTNFEIYLPVLVGGVVAIVVLTVAFVRWKNRVRSEPHRPPVPVRPEEDAWDHLEKSYADQRTSVRRDGRPVPVKLTSPTFRNGMKAGYVVDRSTGGLRIMTESVLAPGSSLQVKADNAPADTAWVTVVVRSCKPGSHGYELGCEFEITPPWNVLLLFG